MKKSILLLLALLTLALPMTRAQQTLTVYDGTDKNEYVPMYPFYYDWYTVSNWVMPASDLAAMTNKNIVSMQFYISNEPYYEPHRWGDIPIVVYMKEVDYTSISAAESLENATVVYQGPLTFSADSTYLTINFTTPYLYQGGNLLIGTYNSQTTRDWGYAQWIGTHADGASLIDWDGYHPWGTSSPWGVFNEQQNFLPKTTFTYTTANALELTVNEGDKTSYYVPMRGYLSHEYQKSECIVPSTSLSAMTGREITQMTYYLNEPCTVTWPDSRFRVFLKEVNTTTISQYTGYDAATTVYLGVLDATHETMVVTFDEPYLYHGGNLLIGFYSELASTAQNKHAGFAGMQASNAAVQGLSLYGLDDVSCTSYNFLPKLTFAYSFVAPSEPVPVNLKASHLNKNQATLSWISDATSFIIEYQVAGTDYWHSIATNASPYLLTGLDPNTNYECRVKAIYGNKESEWSVVCSFTTPPTDVLTLHERHMTDTHVPVNGLFCDNYNKTEFVLPASELSSIVGEDLVRMTFYVSSPANRTWGDANFRVFMKEVNFTDFNTQTNYAGYADGTVLYQGSLDGTHETLEVEFSQPYHYQGGNLLIGFYNEQRGRWASIHFNGEIVTGGCAYGNSSSSLDDVGYYVHDFLPTISLGYHTFAQPTEFTATNVTRYTADLSWTSSASHFVLRYRPVGTNEWTVTDLTTTQYHLESLTLNTHYECQVKATDGANLESVWTNCDFTTPDCEALTVHDGADRNRYVPVFGLYTDAYQKSQFVIPANELAEMDGQQITRMTFYLETPASAEWTGCRFRVYMKEVSTATMSDYFGIADATEVYYGPLDGTQETMVVTFDDPYIYHGGNLLIAIQNERKGSYSNGTTGYYYGENVTGASGMGYSYDNLDDISFTQQNFLPKTTFYYQDPTEYPCPTSLRVSLTKRSAKVTWKSDGRYFRIRYKMNDAADWTISTPSSKEFIFGALEPGTTVECQVMARYYGEFIIDSEWSRSCRFTTPVSDKQLTVYDNSGSSNYIPVYGLYGDAYTKSEFIMPAAKLTEMQGKEINQMTFYLKVPASRSWGNASFRVFMKEVENTQVSEYMGYADATVVYQGPLDGTHDEMVVTFTQPYLYQGGNLLIGFYNETKGTYSLNNTSVFLGYNSSNVANASAYGYSYDNLDAVSFKQLNFLPKTTFGYLDGPQCTSEEQCDFTICLTDMQTSHNGWGQAALKLVDAETQCELASYTVPAGNSGSVDYVLPLCLGRDITVLIEGGETNSYFYWGFEIDNSSGAQIVYWHNLWRGFTMTFNTDCSSCVVPYELEYESDNNELTWEHAVGQYHFNLRYREVGTDTWTYINDYDDNEYRFKQGDLELDTEYEIQIQGICSETEQSAWSSPYTFHSAFCDPDDLCEIWAIMTSLDETGWHGAKIKLVDAATGIVQDSTWLPDNFTQYNIPMYTCSDRDVNIVWEKGNDDGNCAFTLRDYMGEEIYSKPFGTSLANGNLLSTPYIPTCSLCNLDVYFDGIYTMANGAQLLWDFRFYYPSYSKKSTTRMWEVKVTDEATHVTYNLGYSDVDQYGLYNLAPNSTYTFAVRYLCSDEEMSSWYSTTFTTESLIGPTDIEVSDINVNSALVEWSIGNATNFQVRCVNTQTHDTIIYPAPFCQEYMLYGLSANTNYSVSVRSNCTPTIHSEWVTTSFVTPPLENTNLNTFNQAGAWNVASNWSQTTVPTLTDDVIIAAAATIPSGCVATVNSIAMDSNGSITIADGGQLVNNDMLVQVTLEKAIEGYTGSNDHFYLITNPIVDNASFESTGALDNNYDLYTFSQIRKGQEWINLKDDFQRQDYGLNLTMMAGLLYANNTNTTLSFHGALLGTCYQQQLEIFNINAVNLSDFFPASGFNLVGNPYTCNAVVSGADSYYQINPNVPGEFIAVSNPILAPGEGLMTYVEHNGYLIFNREYDYDQAKGRNQSPIGIELMKDDLVIDRAYIATDRNVNMPKLNLSGNATILYFEKDGKAVATTSAEDELTLCLKVNSEGIYTLRVNDVEARHGTSLHLVDTQTGHEIDLNQGSYTFQASPNDNVERFVIKVK